MSAKVLVACPTRGEVWYETAMAITEMVADERVVDFLYVQNNRSVIEARNVIANEFIAYKEADVLVMIDDDVIPPSNVIDLSDRLEEPRVGIVGAPCPMFLPGLPPVPNIYMWDEEEEQAAIDLRVKIGPKAHLMEVDAIGFGCVAIRRQLMEEQSLFFNRWDMLGNTTMGEDIEFCLRAKEAGWRTKADLSLLCEHRCSVHAGGVARSFMDLVKV